MDKVALGRRIQGFRKKQKITAETLAELVDVSTTHIREIEIGRRVPSLNVFVNIANALNVSADELLCGNVKQANRVMLNELFEKVSKLPQDKALILEDVCQTLLKYF